MNTKQLGNIGEAKAISAFVERQIPVFIPFGDNEKADLLVELNGKLKRIQIKTSKKASDGKVEFDLTSCTLHRKNGARHKYNLDEVDYFFCYNVERRKSYLIKNDKTMTVIRLRYEKPKNNQTQNINFEEDYLFKNVIESILTTNC